MSKDSEIEAVAPAKRDCFLSIIINNYNYQQFVGECIESALNICESDCEIIVVDDGSTDDSLSIIRRFSGIKVISKDNGGQASALNAGFSASCGRYVCFLDADDMLVPSALDVIRRTMPEKDMAWFAIEVVSGDGDPISYYPPSRLKPEKNLWASNISKGRAWIHPMSSNVFSAELLEKIFPLPEARWRICADHIAITCAACFAEYRGSNEIINQYRLHGDNRYFGSTLSTFSTHLDAENFRTQHSTNFRHFYVATIDSLLNVENRDRFAGVFSHWISIGELVLAGNLLLENDRGDIYDASERMLKSNTVNFWQEASIALFKTKIDPKHLEAFHNAPGCTKANSVTNTGNAAETVRLNQPALCFGTELLPEAAERYLSGGYTTWNQNASCDVIGASQAMRFSAKVTPLFTVIRLVLSFDVESLNAGVRIAGSNGEIVETVRHGDLWLAEIPGSWTSDGMLRFYFVFEKLSVPVLDGYSAWDACVSGGYINWLKFEVPPASYAFAPLRGGKGGAPAEYLSRLYVWPDDIRVPGGALILSREPIVLAMSLPFSENDVEWLEIEVANSGPAANCVEISVSGEKHGNVSLKPYGSTEIRIPIDFNLFDGRLPELKLSCMATPQEADCILLTAISWHDGPYDHIRLFGGDIVSFKSGEPALGFLGSDWTRDEFGIRPDRHTTAKLTFEVAEEKQSFIELSFSDRSILQDTGSALTIEITLNGVSHSLPLTKKGIYRVTTDRSGVLEIDGWWTLDPDRCPHLAAVRLLGQGAKSVRTASPQEAG